MTNNIWIILGILVVILLSAYWNRRNAVWGGLTLGITVGLMAAIFFTFKGSGFDFSIISKFAVVGTLVGFIAELLGKVSDRLKRKN